MRLGVVYDPAICPYYRAIDPMRAMERRGHDVVWPDDDGRFDQRRLEQCDVVHVYRLAGAPVERAFGALARNGMAFTYDNDDNRASQVVAESGKGMKAGLEGHRVHASTVRMARLARTFTTTTEPLAEKYRRAGVEKIEVIGNYVDPDIPRPRSRHRGIVVGWIAAGPVHQPDADQLRIADALRRLVEKHSDVRVECIGVDVGLSERYRHDPWVPFEGLPGRTGAFDVGIAPLADTPVNRARSDIKVKEYAASGVPWLASPVGAYASLGEEQGGRLVGDDQWFDALDRLVSHRRDRKRLSRKAKAWAASQTIDVIADCWEQVFAEAAR